MPPDGYWPAIADVCRRHGVLLVVDEVMTGFGRTGRWFGVDHGGIRPDLLVAAKGATSGYWPFGFVAAAGPVFETIAASGFVHGFTFSHSITGAAVAREVLRILRDEDLVAASAAKGERLLGLLAERLADHPHVGEIRGRGLLVGLEIVADRSTRAPLASMRRAPDGGARSRRARARGAGLLGHGQRERGRWRPDPPREPPFVVTDDELVADRRRDRRCRDRSDAQGRCDLIRGRTPGEANRPHVPTIGLRRPMPRSLIAANARS